MTAARQFLDHGSLLEVSRQLDVLVVLAWNCLVNAIVPTKVLIGWIALQSFEMRHMITRIIIVWLGLSIWFCVSSRFGLTFLHLLKFNCVFNYAVVGLNLLIS